MITTQTNNPFIVKVNGEVDPKLSNLSGRPTVHERIERVKANFKLEMKIRLYDKLHGTNYLYARRYLLAECRNQEFEHAIGLSRSK